MKARLIVTTIVMGGLRARRRRDRARGQAGGARHVEVPRPQGRGSGSPQPREPAAERVPALLERDREHRRGAVGDASRERARDRRRRRPRSRRSASSNAQYLCGTQPKPNDPCYTILAEQAVSIFEYHPTHNHWHTADVARFEVRKGSPTGTVVGGNSIKVGFCLLDLYNLDGNAPTSEKVFWDCYTSYQGISVGLGRPVPPGDRRPAGRSSRGSRTPPTTTSSRRRTRTGAFLETDKTNNTAWVKFTLSSDSNGNRKVTVTGHSPCESPGMCGELSPNR